MYSQQETSPLPDSSRAISTSSSLRVSKLPGIHLDLSLTKYASSAVYLLQSLPEVEGYITG